MATALFVGGVKSSSHELYPGHTRPYRVHLMQHGRVPSHFVLRALWRVDQQRRNSVSNDMHLPASLAVIMAGLEFYDTLPSYLTARHQCLVAGVVHRLHRLQTCVISHGDTEGIRLRISRSSATAGGCIYLDGKGTSGAEKARND